MNITAEGIEIKDFKKIGTLQFLYFTKGDFVRTPMGVGQVIEDEKYIISEIDFYHSEIKIQHKNGCSENTSNEPYWIERETVLRIDKNEYDF